MYCQFHQFKLLRNCSSRNSPILILCFGSFIILKDKKTCYTHYHQYNNDRNTYFFHDVPPKIPTYLLYMKHRKFCLKSTFSYHFLSLEAKKQRSEERRVGKECKEKSKKTL